MEISSTQTFIQLSEEYSSLSQQIEFNKRMIEMSGKCLHPDVVVNQTLFTSHLQYPSLATLENSTFSCSSMFTCKVECTGPNYIMLQEYLIHFHSLHIVANRIWQLVQLNGLFTAILSLMLLHSLFGFSSMYHGILLNLRMRNCDCSRFLTKMSSRIWKKHIHEIVLFCLQRFEEKFY